MNIYVDFDDCICETARYFSRLVGRLYGIDVPYEKIRCFDLQKSFSITDEQYERLMIEGHRTEVLLSYDETPGASKTINGWCDSGHAVSVITGRPYSAWDASRIWLDEHGLKRVKLYCLDKYGRDKFIKGSKFNLELEDFQRMRFDYAVEDSPEAFKFFCHLPELKVMVFDRPWNKNTRLVDEKYLRCSDWEDIREAVKADA